VFSNRSCFFNSLEFFLGAGFKSFLFQRKKPWKNAVLQENAILTRRKTSTQQPRQANKRVNAHVNQ